MAQRHRHAAHDRDTARSNWPGRCSSTRTNLAFGRGVVGGLAETMDAYPHPGEAQPRLTGTFLQAWSNAEQLRVWYQYVLGVRPDMSKGEIVLAPRLAGSLGAVEFTVRRGGRDTRRKLRPRRWQSALRLSPGRATREAGAGHLALRDRQLRRIAGGHRDRRSHIGRCSRARPVGSGCGEKRCPAAAFTSQAKPPGRAGRHPRRYRFRDAEAAGITQGDATAISRGRGSISAPAREAPCGRRAVRPG